MVDFLVKYPRLGRLFDLLLPLLATLAALGVGAIMLQLLGANPFMAYSALLKGAFGSQNALADTIVRATPLLLVGLGICIAFRAGVINIGGEGQFIAGALPATLLGLSFPDAPALVLVPAALLCGFLGGDAESVLQRQRNPQHDHAQHDRRADDELPAARADD